MGISDPQIIKLVDIRHIFVKMIYLIDCQHHRLMGTPEQIRHLGIRIHKPLFYVHHKKDDIRGVNGNLGLLPHLG